MHTRCMYYIHLRQSLHMCQVAEHSSRPIHGGVQVSVCRHARQLLQLDIRPLCYCSGCRDALQISQY